MHKPAMWIELLAQKHIIISEETNYAWNLITVMYLGFLLFEKLNYSEKEVGCTLSDKTQCMSDTNKVYVRPKKIHRPAAKI